MNDRGLWLTTISGRRFYPLDPMPSDVDAWDITHALSHLCRFAGHCRRFYSVAQHSVLVSEAVGQNCGEGERGWDVKGIDWPRAALCALLHDSAEAYVVDLPRPVKCALPGYRDIEDRVHRAILQKFGLVDVYPEFESLIKEADTRALVTEFRDLTDADLRDTELAHVRPYPQRVVALDPAPSITRFWARYMSLRATIREMSAA